MFKYVVGVLLLIAQANVGITSSFFLYESDIPKKLL